MVDGAPSRTDITDLGLRPGAQGLTLVDVEDGQARLIVTFARPLIDRGGHLAPDQRYLLEPRRYQLTGGHIVTPRIVRVDLYNPDGTGGEQHGRRVVLQLDRDGDASVYTLTVTGPTMDPRFSSRRLQFGLSREVVLDCRPSPSAAPLESAKVSIDYLAKDYASFRQALLDFVPTRQPDWTEQSEADIGIMLLELFAATADELSYTQDRVANEAFLDTATQRRSVAGHLALIGYELDEGAAASTWLQFDVTRVAPITAGPGLRVATVPEGAIPPDLGSDVIQGHTAGPRDVVVFEPIVAVTLRPEHNRMSLYGWGEPAARVLRTAQSAALVGAFPELGGGDCLLFEDRRGNRAVVRLTAAVVVPADPITARPDGPLTLVYWSDATPLRRDFLVRESVVRGNLVFATQGESVTEVLQPGYAGGPLPAPARHPRYGLGYTPLTYLDPGTCARAVGYHPPGPLWAASSGIRPRSTSTLTLLVNGERWREVRTLLTSGPDAPVYRLEVGDRGDATVVFGNGEFGRRPDGAARITVTYRIGTGDAGNVSADVLVQVRPRTGEDVSWLVRVTNPLPATGGRDPESTDHARRFGPSAVPESLVALSADDYDQILQDLTDIDGQHPVRRAQVAFRWTGSWLTATALVEATDREPLSPALRSALHRALAPYVPAGYDLDVLGPRYVPLDLALAVQLAAGARDLDVVRDLEQALVGPTRSGAFFGPDGFGFGESLLVSELYAAILKVHGVAALRIATLARSGAVDPIEETRVNLRRGRVLVVRDEIIRLDNDPRAPGNGRLAIGVESPEG